MGIQFFKDIFNPAISAAAKDVKVYRACLLGGYLLTVAGLMLDYTSPLGTDTDNAGALITGMGLAMLTVAVLISTISAVVPAQEEKGSLLIV